MPRDIKEYLEKRLKIEENLNKKYSSSNNSGASSSTSIGGIYDKTSSPGV